MHGGAEALRLHHVMSQNREMLEVLPSLLSTSERRKGCDLHVVEWSVLVHHCIFQSTLTFVLPYLASTLSHNHSDFFLLSLSTSHVSPSPVLSASLLHTASSNAHSVAQRCVGADGSHGHVSLGETSVCLSHMSRLVHPGPICTGFPWPTLPALRANASSAVDPSSDSSSSRVVQVCWVLLHSEPVPTSPRDRACPCTLR